MIDKLSEILKAFLYLIDEPKGKQKPLMTLLEHPKPKKFISYTSAFLELCSCGLPPSPFPSPPRVICNNLYVVTVRSTYIKSYGVHNTKYILTPIDAALPRSHGQPTCRFDSPSSSDASP